jgi:hypothetical protein
MEPVFPAPPRRGEVDEQMLASVLSPYKPHCQYLRAADVEYPQAGPTIAAASGRFSIPESCYIASTGHFNAVEFNICYNQLTYTLLARAIADQALAPFAGWTVGEFRRRQLADFLIARFFSCFHRPITGGSFDGRVEIVHVATRRTSTFMKTVCRFDDEHGGHAEGGALIAIVESGRQASASRLE